MFEKKGLQKDIIVSLFVARVVMARVVTKVAGCAESVGL